VRSGGTRGVLQAGLFIALHVPGLRWLIGRKDFQDLRLSVMETFFESVPSSMIVERNSQEHRYVVRGEDGESTIFFRELKDVAGLGSQEFGLITVHEAHEISEQSYRTIKMRATQPGRTSMIILEGNPPLQSHWLNKLQDPDSTDYDPDLEVMILPTHENAHNLAPAYVASLERMPPLWRKRYLLGECGMLPDGTPVYPTCVESVHVRPTRIIPDRPIIRGWDFGLRRAACIWGQRADNGQILWHREWLAIETPEEEFIDGVMARTVDWFGEVVCMDYGDVASRQRDPHGVSTLTRLEQKGIQLQTKMITFAERIPMINHQFSQMLNGKPKVVIDPRCSVLVEGLLGGYHYPSLKEGSAFTMTKDLPYKDGWYDHMVDAFSYAMVFVCGQTKAAEPKGIMRMLRHRRFAAQKRGTVSF